MQAIQKAGHGVEERAGAAGLAGVGEGLVLDISASRQVGWLIGRQTLLDLLGHLIGQDFLLTSLKS